jgi:hypothetical protein
LVPHGRRLVHWPLATFRETGLSHEQQRYFSVIGSSPGAQQGQSDMRKSYSARTFRVLELALYHSLGKLPEPELTHDFF